jgi:hypothetical protein
MPFKNYVMYELCHLRNMSSMTCCSVCFMFYGRLEFMCVLCYVSVYVCFRVCVFSCSFILLCVFYVVYAVIMKCNANKWTPVQKTEHHGAHMDQIAKKAPNLGFTRPPPPRGHNSNSSPTPNHVIPRCCSRRIGLLHQNSSLHRLRGRLISRIHRFTIRF